MLSVGLTGGIGSGKSEVARRLAAYGAVVIDADVLARAVVEPGTPGFDRVVEAFGPQVVAPSGGLDRAAVAEIVFADASQRERLEAIVHPLVAERAVAARSAAPAGAVVVYDVPLLVENGLAPEYDVVVVVDASDELRLHRLLERGLSEADARARMGAQATREERLAAADHVVGNDGSLADLDVEVERLWAELERRVRT